MQTLVKIKKNFEAPVLDNEAVRLPILAAQLSIRLATATGFKLRSYQSTKARLCENYF